jgi:uncharacterized membrane protein
LPIWVAAATMSGTLALAQDMPGDVTAAGNEPFWRVEIAGAGFTLTRPDFEPLMLSVVERRTEADGTHVIVSASSSPALRAVLSLAPGPATTPWPTRPIRSTATLELGDTVLRGCGGDPRDLLTASEVWTVTEIAGEAIVEGTEVTLGFGPEGGLTRQRRMQPDQQRLRDHRRGSVDRARRSDADGLSGRDHGAGDGVFRRAGGGLCVRHRGRG